MAAEYGPLTNEQSLRSSGTLELQVFWREFVRAAKLSAGQSEVVTKVGIQPTGGGCARQGGG